jgi:hypothetical protein
MMDGFPIVLRYRYGWLPRLGDVAIALTFLIILPQLAAWRYPESYADLTSRLSQGDIEPLISPLYNFYHQGLDDMLRMYWSMRWLVVLAPLFALGYILKALFGSSKTWTISETEIHRQNLYLVGKSERIWTIADIKSVGFTRFLMLLPFHKYQVQVKLKSGDTLDLPPQKTEAQAMALRGKLLSLIGD